MTKEVFCYNILLVLSKQQQKGKKMYREPRFSQYTGREITSWLKRNSRAVIFFWCGWRELCEKMKVFLEKCHAELIKSELPEIEFVWIDADERGDLCEELSVPSVPTVVFFKKAEEVARFSCLTSREAIRHQIENLMGKEFSTPAESYF